MKKQHLFRLSAILLFLSIILGIMPRNAFLANAAAVDQTEQLVLRAEDVPEYFTLAEMQNAGHVKRADRNDVAHLNEIEFQNADGTYTVYAFNENVRYITASGDYKDKSNRLERSSDGAYTNPQNDIRVNYPEKIGQGVTVTRDTFSLTMVPAYTSNASVAQSAKNEASVYYANAFGTNTVLQYTQTFNGFKEDIILSSVPESNQFRFTMTTNGATLSMDGDKLLVSVDGEEVGCFQPIYIYDSDGNSCYGSMQMLASSAARNTYSVIITAPWDFLTDTDTVYPVTVDPTFTLNNSSSAVIQDTNVFTNSSENYGIAPTMSIGDYSQYPGDEPRGIGYGLVRFPFLTGDTSVAARYNAGRITEMKYYFTVTNCLTATPLQAGVINTTWPESTVTYSNVSSAISNAGPTYTQTISATSSSAQEYSFDLLTIIDASNYNNMATKGLVLSTVPTYMPALTMGTADAASSSGYRAYVKYTYIGQAMPQISGIDDDTVYMLVNTLSGKAINGAAPSSQISASIPYETSLFTLEFCRAENTTNGYYQIRRFNSELLLTGTSSGLSMAEYDSTDTQKWHITFAESGTSYQIRNAGLNGYLVTTNGNSQSVSYSLSETGSEWFLVPYILNVPLHKQEETDTCGQACVRMILGGHGLTVTETTIKNHSTNSGAQNLVSTINYFLPNLTPQYNGQIIFYDYNDYINIIKANIDNGYPVIINAIINDPSHEYFGYHSGTGHYLVCKGYYYNPAGTLILVVNDPHYDIGNVVHCRTIHIPATAMYGYCNPNNHFILGAYTA